MLVLTRRRNESILINGDIRIEIISTRGRQVRLGIAAPDHVAVDRSEVRGLKANGDAAGSASSGADEET